MTGLQPILIVLAAGAGRRYGGDKQRAGIGPDGQWLIEYAVHDALAAGFARVVVVTREDLRDTLERRLAPALHGRAELVFALQSLDRVPDGCRTPAARTKPLGTGHALWCAGALLDGPFAVINADDFYGAQAFERLAVHLRSGAGAAMVGFRLARTLSAHGGVNRGVCTLDGDGHLAGVVEYADIRIGAGARIDGRDGNGVRRQLDADAFVSLNCWGFQTDLLPVLERGLREFLAGAGADDEYYLPAAIDRYLAGGAHRLAVLESDDDWLGLTYADDNTFVAAKLAALHATGRYAGTISG